MRKKRIAFDIDGVLINFMEVFSWLLNKNGYIIKPHDCFNVETVPQLSEESIQKYISKTHRYWERYRPMPGALSLIGEAWIITERPIQFVTSRFIHSATETHLAVKNILGRHIPFSITFAIGNSKHLYLEDIEYFVEDRRKYAQKIAMRGTDVFIPRRDYNHIPDPSNRIHFIDDLYQLRDELRILL